MQLLRGRPRLLPPEFAARNRFRLRMDASGSSARPKTVARSDASPDLSVAINNEATIGLGEKAAWAMPKTIKG